MIENASLVGMECRDTCVFSVVLDAYLRPEAEKLLSWGFIWDWGSSFLSDTDLKTYHANLLS